MAIGPYVILEELGRGSMGIVYRARDERLDRDVALKVLWPDLVHSPTLVERFRREAMAASSIEHPNVVRVYDAQEIDGQFIIIMALHSSRTLLEALDRPWPVDHAIAAFKQILQGLYAAHRRGIVHRDVKPGNILFDLEQRHLALTDFGLAHLPTEMTLTIVGEVLGTPSYLAPEAARGVAVDARADVFSAGVVFYRLLTGRLPFEDSSHFLRFDNSGAKPILRPMDPGVAVPREIEAILFRCLAVDPVERYSHAGEVLDELHRLEAGRLSLRDEVHHELERPEPRLQPWPNRGKRLFGRLTRLVGALLAALSPSRRTARMEIKQGLDLAAKQRDAALRVLEQLVFERSLARGDGGDSEPDAAVEKALRKARAAHQEALQTLDELYDKAAILLSRTERAAVWGAEFDDAQSSARLRIVGGMLTGCLVLVSIGAYRWAQAPGEIARPGLSGADTSFQSAVGAPDSSLPTIPVVSEVAPGSIHGMGNIYQDTLIILDHTEARFYSLAGAGPFVFRFGTSSAKAVPIEVRVYDARGVIVRTLGPYSFGEGRHEVAWDGRLSNGGLAVGQYTYQIARAGAPVDSIPGYTAPVAIDLPTDTGENIADIPSFIFLPSGAMRGYFPLIDSQGVGRVISAASSDGIHWLRDPGVRWEKATWLGINQQSDGLIRMYYPKGNREIGSAVSTDGLNFTGEAGYRLVDRAVDMGGHISNPVIAATSDGRSKMYYWASSTGSQSIVSASSLDGISWTRDPGERIGSTSSEPGTVVEGAPNVRCLVDGTMAMLYVARQSDQDGYLNNQIREARSNNGIDWNRVPPISGYSDANPKNCRIVWRPDGAVMAYCISNDGRPASIQLWTSYVVGIINVVRAHKMLSSHDPA